RQSVGERRTVIEHVLVLAVLPCRALVDGGLERAVVLPVLKDVLLEFGQVRGTDDAFCFSVARIERGCHEWSFGSCCSCSELARGRRSLRFPRYHLGCTHLLWVNVCPF